MNRGMLESARSLSLGHARLGSFKALPDEPKSACRIASQRRELIDRGIFLCSEIAKGGQGAVWRAVCADQSAAAVKIIKKHFTATGVVRDSQANYVRREVEILKAVNHPGLVKFIDFCESQTEWFIITEFVEGEDLFERLGKKSISEKQLLILAAQLLHTLAYLHSLGISHRDVKLENIMLERAAPLHIKLIDFGLSHWNDGTGTQSVNTFYGTKEYKAPELLRRVPNTNPLPCDVYAVGALIFTIITGEFPISDEAINSGKLPESISFRSDAWKKVSPGTRELARSFLMIDPDMRPTAEEAYRLVRDEIGARAALERTRSQSKLSNGASHVIIEADHEKPQSPRWSILATRKNALNIKGVDRMVGALRKIGGQTAHPVEA